MKLGHLHIHTRSRDASEAFYRKWFGMEVQRRLERLTFMIDSDAFELALMDDAAPQAMPPWFHFGFRLDAESEVLELNREMMAAGVPITKALYRDSTLASFRCADLDGYNIEIYWERLNPAAESHA